jgi:hypothetical protein
VPASLSSKIPIPQQRRFSFPGEAIGNTFEERFGSPPKCIFPPVSTVPAPIDGSKATDAPILDFLYGGLTQVKILAKFLSCSCLLILLVSIKTLWWYAKYNHDQRKANLVHHTHRNIKNLMSKPLSPEKDRESGHVYIFLDNRHDDSTRFKIGYTAKSAISRYKKHHTWYIESERVPNARRAEHLCHVELDHWRDKSDKDANRSKDDEDYVGSECFYLPKDIVKQTMHRWCDFVCCDPSPYDENGHLKSDWSELLVQVDDIPCIYEEPEHHHIRHERWTNILKLVKDETGGANSFISGEVKRMMRLSKRWISRMEAKFLRWDRLQRVGAMFAVGMGMYKQPLVLLKLALAFLVWTIGRVIFVYE